MHGSKLAASVSALATLLAFAPLGTAAELPAPRGGRSIATSIYYLQDPGRAAPAGQGTRAIAVQAWYPTSAVPTHRRAPYIGWEVGRTLVEEQYYGQPADVLETWSNLETHAAVDAAPTVPTGGFAVIVWSPGLGMTRSSYTTLAEDLASFGFLVLTVDHPFGGITRNGRGGILSLADDEGFSDDPDSAARMEAAWAGDLMHVTDWLLDPRGPWSGRVDAGRMAAVGHSLGGAAAFEACRRDDRLRACVNLDGPPFGAVLEEGVGAPALFVKAVPEYSDADLERLGRTRQQWDAMNTTMRAMVLRPLTRNPDGPSYSARLRRTGHLSFSDAPFVMPGTITRYSPDVLTPLRTRDLVSDLIRTFVEEIWSDGERMPDRFDGVHEIDVEVISGR